MKEEIVIKRKDKEEYMSLDVVSRWISLIESMNIIQDECERTKRNPDNYLDAKAIDLYIKDRYCSVYEDVRREYYMGIL